MNCVWVSVSVALVVRLSLPVIVSGLFARVFTTRTSGLIPPAVV